MESNGIGVGWRLVFTKTNEMINSGSFFLDLLFLYKGFLYLVWHKSTCLTSSLRISYNNNV